MPERQADGEWVPTVDDLRVKLCYICREEERFDNPEDPPRAWTHPCACTLVAHESCLLQWIKTAQQDPANARNPLKCAQCGAVYEISSDNPLVLRLLNAVNAVLGAAGKAATVVGFVGVAMSFGFTIYAVSTSYGAFAVKEFLGEEMYNLLLSDDPAKWPWQAFIHLPMIPFSLILSRTRLFDSFPVFPLIITWATTPSIHDRTSSGISPTSTTSLRSLLGLTRASAPSPAAWAPSAINWPPTPLMIMFFFPVLRVLYRRAFARLTKWVMGPTAANARDASGLGRIRRIIWAMNDDGPAPLRVRIGANVEPAAANPPRPAPAPAPAADAPAGGDAPDDPAADAERTLHVTTSTLGQFVGGALLVPSISSRMGALLLRLSKHSPLLRAFLAVRDRPSVSAPAPMRLLAPPADGKGGLLRQLGAGFLGGINVLCGGTPAWNQHDPVWWRNAVGLGLFVFTKDCIQLLHLWLTKRELESRRVKSRSFAGVDIGELDLIRPPPLSQNDAAPADPGTSGAQGDIVPTES